MAAYGAQQQGRTGACALRAGDDVLIGKTSPLPDEAPGMAQRWSKKDLSTSLRNSESGMVDSVMLSTNDAGARFVKVRVWPQPMQRGLVSLHVRAARFLARSGLGPGSSAAALLCCQGLPCA